MEESWKNVLTKMQNELPDIQIAHKKEIIQAFKDMLFSNVTEEDFGDYLTGIVVFPEMLHSLWSLKPKIGE